MRLKVSQNPDDNLPFLQGIFAIQFHGNFDAPVDFYAKLCEFGFNDNKNPVFISIPSFYAVSWCDELTKIIKTHTI